MNSEGYEIVYCSKSNALPSDRHGNDERRRQFKGKRSTSSRAVRRRHCVGGGQFRSAARCRRRSKEIGGGGEVRRGLPKTIFSNIPEKNFVLISFYPQNVLITFFSHRKLQQNNYAATMALAARRQIIGGGDAPINRSWRRRTALLLSQPSFSDSVA